MIRLSPEEKERISSLPDKEFIDIVLNSFKDVFSEDIDFIRRELLSRLGITL